MDGCAQLVLHPPRNVQQVQLVVQEMAESAVVLPRVADDASGSIQYSLELVCARWTWMSGKNGVAVVHTWDSCGSFAWTERNGNPVRRLSRETAALGCMCWELTEHQASQFRCIQSSRYADARDQWTRPVIWSTWCRSVQVSSVLYTLLERSCIYNRTPVLERLPSSTRREDRTSVVSDPIQWLWATCG